VRAEGLLFRRLGLARLGAPEIGVAAAERDHEPCERCSSSFIVASETAEWA
jgi:hypothetical protein